MKQTAIKVSLALIFGVCTMAAQAATLNTGDRLTINPGGATIAGFTGSWFAADYDQSNKIEDTEKTALHQGTEGIIIGVIQATGTPTHGGAPYPTDWNRITKPYSWFGNTAQEYTTSPITGSTTTGLNFSGLNWPWNGIEDIDFNTGAWGAGFSNGIANFVWDGVYGHSYTIDYHASTPLGDPTGFGGVKWAYHFEGTVVPLPAAAWLLGSGLLGLIGVAGRQKSRRAV